MAKKIMLVEDDSNLREIYGARLLAESYEIVSAQDGEEALALAVKEKPDLIISDVMMPKISGFDMLDILRSTPETKDTKIIMMTALSQVEDKARASKLGADKYLVKSQVTLEDVARVVHEILGDAPADSSDVDTPEETDEPVDTASAAPIVAAPIVAAATDAVTPAADPVAAAPVTEGSQPVVDAPVADPVVPAAPATDNVQPTTPADPVIPTPAATDAVTPAADPVAAAPVTEGSGSTEDVPPSDPSINNLPGLSLDGGSTTMPEANLPQPSDGAEQSSSLELPDLAAISKSLDPVKTTDMATQQGLETGLAEAKTATSAQPAATESAEMAQQINTAIESDMSTPEVQAPVTTAPPTPAADPVAATTPNAEVAQPAAEKVNVTVSGKKVIQPLSQQAPVAAPEPESAPAPAAADPYTLPTPDVAPPVDPNSLAL